MLMCFVNEVLTGAMCVQPELHGMLPVNGDKFEALQQSAVQWSNSLKQSAAVCNSLNLVNKTRVVGDVADFAAFKACEARFLVRAHMCPRWVGSNHT